MIRELKCERAAYRECQVKPLIVESLIRANDKPRRIVVSIPFDLGVCPLSLASLVLSQFERMFSGSLPLDVHETLQIRCSYDSCAIKRML